MQPPPRPWKKAVFRAVRQAETALRSRHAPAHRNPEAIRNFLVLQYDTALGSAVHATPLFEALKQTIPEANITVAASPMAAAVLAHNPFIDRCIVTPHPAGDLLRAARTLRSLRQSMPSGPSALLTTIGNRRPRVALLSLAAADALRAGHTAAPELYYLPLDFQPERGQIEGNLDILRALGHAVKAREPRMFFTAEDAAYAAQLLAAAPAEPGASHIAYITRNSAGQRNQWSEDRFRQVIAALSASLGAVPVFIGAAADAPAIESLRNTLPEPGISAAGKTTIPQLAALLAQCDLAVSLDTGPFHVARAVALPGVVLAPAWQNPREWLPIDHPRYRVLWHSAGNAPPDQYRMEEISCEEVIAAATELLREYAPSAPARRGRLDRACIDFKNF